MKRIVFLAVSLCLVSWAGLSAGDKDGPQGDEEKQLFSILKSEISRSMDELKKKGSIPPYFIAYTLRDSEGSTVNSSYGAIYTSNDFKLRKLIVEVRVGNYEYDNTDVNTSMGRLVSSFVSVDGDIESLKRDIWFQTNSAYEYAVKLYYMKKQKGSDKFKKEVNVPSFTKEKSHRYFESAQPFRFDRGEIETFLKGATAVFKKYPEIQFDITRANYGNEKTFFVNSEGSEILTKESVMSVMIDAGTQADGDGSDVRNSGSVFYSLNFEKLDLSRVKAEIDKIAGELIALKKARQISPETGPAILAPQATGILFHEAVGHRLEGERQEDEQEGQTFKDSVGKKVIPEFITIIDDPSLKEFGGVFLNGYYEFDEQGIPGQRVELIKDGVLKSFLMSRTPIEKFYQSNGHGRAYDDFVPMARMSNTIVRSSKEVKAKELKSVLMKQARKQGKSHGFLLKSMIGGETETGAVGFQVYKSVPLMVYRVDAKTGKEELVRGVEIVGTPLTSINKILMTGDDYEVKNGYCNAESGWVRVSTLAPSALLSEIELQNKKSVKKQLPIISRPK